MGEFRILVDGDDADHAANELAEILAEGEDSAVVSRSVTSHHDGTSKIVDPVALAGVILAIPSAILAVMDIADRIRKRGKAEKLTAAAKRLHSEKHVTMTVVAPDGTTWSLDRLEADTVLEIADRTR